MTAFRFARVALPSLALTLGSLVLPSTAGGGVLEDDAVFAADAPDTGGPATRQLAERRRANDGDWFRAPMQQGPQDFPTDLIHDAVVANTRAATARAMYRRAESAMHAAARAAQRDFEQSKELKEALAEEQRAYDALQDARREALKDVIDDPNYQRMQYRRDLLTERIIQRREGAGETIMRVSAGPRLVSTEVAGPRALPADDETIISIATVKLRVGSDVSALEREALADNEKVRQARSELVAAGAKVSALRGGFDRSLRENADFKAARDELEEARIARVTAATYFKGASLAAREALDYSYYLHRYDYYRYNQRDYGYGYNPYRSGFPYYGASYIRR
jgi:hypothetical protein